MSKQILKIPASIRLKRGKKAALESEKFVPGSGEMIYETDTKKIKIGDGVSEYSQLPYFRVECEVPDDVFNAKIEELQKDIARVDSDSTNERNLIKEAYAAADGVIAAEVEKIEEQLVNVSVKHSEDVNTIMETINNLPSVNLDGIINDLNNHITTSESSFSSLQENIEQINNNLTSVQASLASAQNDRTLIREQYANADEILRTAHEADKTELVSKIAAGDLEVATDLANEIARATAKEADILADMKAYADGIKTNLLGDGVLNETYDTLTEIAAWITEDGVDATELVSAIAVETNERKSADAATEATIAANKTEILGKLDTTDKKHQEDIATTNSTIASLGNELRGVDTAINTRIDEIIQQFTDAINLVYTNYQAEDQARKAEVIEYFNTQLGVIENGSY